MLAKIQKLLSRKEKGVVEFKLYPASVEARCLPAPRIMKKENVVIPRAVIVDEAAAAEPKIQFVTIKDLKEKAKGLHGEIELAVRQTIEGLVCLREAQDKRASMIRSPMEDATPLPLDYLLGLLDQRDLAFAWELIGIASQDDLDILALIALGDKLEFQRNEILGA